jgi:hypothetical protein
MDHATRRRDRNGIGDRTAILRPRLVALGLAIVLGFTACSESVTGSSAATQRDSLQFSFVPVDPDPSIFAPPDVTVRGGEGVIVIDGFVVAPCNTWIMRAGLTRGSDGYHLRLFYRLPNEFCEHAVRHRWHAVIVGAQPGIHTVRVRQPIFDRGRPGFVVVTVADAQVAVTPSRP